MGLSRLRSTVSSPRSGLAALAGSSLFLHFGADELFLSIQAVLQIFAGSAVVSLILAGLAIANNFLWVLSISFQWLLYGYFIIKFAIPGVLRGWPEQIDAECDCTGRLAERSGFRVLVGSISVGFGMVFATAFPPDIFTFTQDAPASILGSIFGISSESEAISITFGIFAAGVITLSWYLLTKIGWSETPPTTRVGIRAQTGRVGSDRMEEWIEELQQSGWPGIFNSYALLLYTAVRLTMFCGLFGSISAIGAVLFPLPEAAAITGTAIGGVTDRTWWVSRPIVLRIGDLEHRLVRTMGYCLRSPKGGPVFGVVFLGILYSAVWVFLGVLLGPIMAARMIDPAGFQATNFSDLYDAWGLSVALLSQFLIGIYTLWFWLREIRRVPYFLTFWEATHGGSMSTNQNNGKKEGVLSPVARPVGHVIPPVLLGISLVLPLEFLPTSAQNIYSAGTPIIWTAGSGILLWIGYRAISASVEEIQTVEREDRVLLGAAIVQTFAFALSISLGGPPPRFMIGNAAMISFCLILGFYFPETELVFQSLSQWRRRQAQTAYLLALGVTSWILAPMLPPWTSGIRVLGGLAIIGSVFILLGGTIERYYDI